MRPILFRAWFSREKRMYSPEEFMGMSGFWMWVQGQNPKVIPMQFTGVTDKNGTKVFEGDVVKWALEDEHWVAPVYYDKEAACFWMGDEVEDPNEGAVLNDWMRGEYEVLGNQYQHPELLTSNQKEAIADDLTIR